MRNQGLRVLTAVSTPPPDLEKEENNERTIKAEDFQDLDTGISFDASGDRGVVSLFWSKTGVV